MNAITIGFKADGKPVLLAGPDVAIQKQRNIMVMEYKAEKWPVDIVKAELFLVDTPSIRAIARAEQIKPTVKIKPTQKGSK